MVRKKEGEYEPKNYQEFYREILDMLDKSDMSRDKGAQNGQSKHGRP